MKKPIFDSITCASGGLAGFLFGYADGLFFALVAFAVIDYVTGIIGAAIKRKLSSRVGFEGIFKKVMLFVLVALANIIDVQVLGGAHAILRTAVITFLLANEGLSILENVAAAGVPVPKKLLNLLEQLKNQDKSDKSDKSDESDESEKEDSDNE
jgi:toxin secretion/phage lysis holin